jgi:NSS family neurotransmitter:Na+ symporter
MEKRATFTGSIGFVMAAAGSAVGLGNIWRFPYLAAKYGGGVFLLVYIILVLTFGFSLMIAENAIGRKTGKSPLYAFAAINKKWAFVGILATIVPVIILPYYNVIGGWVIKYCEAYVTGQSSALAADGYFEGMLGNHPILLIVYQLIFTATTTVIVACGVEKGIERFSKILMPLLVVLAIVISIYSVTLPGAMLGVKYFFVPDFSNFTFSSILAAMGQMFFSLSLAMGIMISYGSYLPKDCDLEKSVSKIEIFDTAIAILAGLMIIPAVFAFSGGDEEALGKGAGLMFITIPKVFDKMGMASFMGTMFFLLVLFAALTSAVSVMEAIVPALMEKFKMKRVKASVITGIYAFLLGTVTALGYNKLSWISWNGMTILDILDFVSNSILMPITALLTCIFVGYIAGVKMIGDEVSLSGKFRREKLFVVMIKYIAPVFVVAILISSVLDTLGVFKL